jgi:hypothetical protein
MLNQEEIDDLMRRLSTYRRTRSHYLEQLALQGRAFVLPHIIPGIREAQQEIDRIKKALREEGIQVANHPDDDYDIITTFHEERKYQGKNQELDFENALPSTDGSISSKESSLLIGALIDVSRSVLDTIEASANKSSIPRTKLDKSIKVIIEKFLLFGRTPEAEDVLPRFGLFLYGYGFGRLRSSANRILNTLGIRPIKDGTEVVSSESVRDFFAEVATKENIPTTPLGTELNKYKDLYQKSVEAQLLDIGLGKSTLLQALETVHQRFIQENTENNFNNMLLIIISDGNINDDESKAIYQAIDRIKKNDIQILCGYIGKENFIQSRTLYNQPNPIWSSSATRLFDFSSSSNTSNPIIVRMLDLARESGWQAPTNTRLFIQVNQIEMLEELIDFILNAIHD